MKRTKLCPICGEGHLASNSIIETREFNGFSGDVLIHYSTCDECGCDTATDEDMKQNVRAMNAFKKKCLDLLPGSEISRIRKKLGISQKEAAMIFGGGPTAFTKYEHDDVIQSVSMDNTIRLADTSSDAFGILCRRKGFYVKPVVSFEEVIITSTMVSDTKSFNHYLSGWASMLLFRQNTASYGHH